MRKLRVLSSKLAVAALLLLVGRAVPGEPLARQSGAFGIVTYDLPPVTETQTTPVPVLYAWLDAHVPGVAHEAAAYEAAAKATAANGRPVWACYALGLDPQDATRDFRIASFPMKADGTPDFANVIFDPPQEQWNVPDAPVVWKGAATLEGPWMTVAEEVGRGVPPSRSGSPGTARPTMSGSPGTARPTMQFFKAVVFGDADDDLGGVQLWEGGPYWAECNVGAEEPWEYGYYFWWGDTVGYTRSGGTWLDYGYGDGSGYYSGVTWVSSTGQQMSSSPFVDSSCPTYCINDAALQSAGYIDSTGNLVAAHDAATAHLGAPWRMPTSEEIGALIENCTTTWITTNGVSGRLVTGKGTYANRSIFLPAAGRGGGSSLYDPGSDGNYWSSTPDSGYSYYAWNLFFHYSSSFGRNYNGRYVGQSVRPVRELAPAPTTMVTITFNANGGVVSPSSQSYVAYEAYNYLPAPSYAGYTFAGWYTESSGGTLVTSSSFVPASDTTLFAHWTANDPGTEDLGGVQLWEGGPYWAECNVGATKPEEYGYYFWWGDTVGYTRSGGTWNDYGIDGSGYYSGVTWVSSTGQQMSSSPFSSSSCPTYDKSNAALQSAGYIDSTGNLVAAHDAATAHLGAPWRMPTDAEFAALIENCTTTWITTNGVSGRLVTGKGAYADRSIFLPAAGFGYGSYLYFPGSDGNYWSSTPRSDDSDAAWYLRFDSSNFGRYTYGRYFGLSVRPVRGFAE